MMGWNLQADGSYAHDSFPVRLLSQGGQAVLKMTGDAVQRVLPLDDLWNNPLDPTPLRPSALECEIYEERFSSGVNGGAASAGINARLINYRAITGAGWAGAPSSGQFQIITGGSIMRFLVVFQAPCRQVNGHNVILRDITNATDYYGSSMRTDNTLSVGATSIGFAYITLNSDTTYELASYCQTANASTTALGSATFNGASEIYGSVVFLRVE